MTRLSFRSDASSRAVTIGAVALAASACAAIARAAGYNLAEDAAIGLSVIAGVFLLVVHVLVDPFQNQVRDLQIIFVLHEHMAVPK